MPARATQTHTYVTMALSAAAYAEIKQKMLEAGYDHAFGSDGEIDMNGIAVVPEEAEQVLLKIGCRLKGGYRLTLLDGQSIDLQGTADQPRARGFQGTITTGDSGRQSGGFAVTEVPAEFWFKWLNENGARNVVKSREIFLIEN
jgi:hypothetical protein